ncbi:hypothetical protein L2E82_53561 [Cichorium intybus]|nr:hypothetical protein L2E82_53698 [Cichorium intybus]KAI3671178.1 hypothetical protein L2E82_53561 [Cichorium intybus]
MTSLSFPFHPDHHSGQHIQTSGSVQPAIMRLMLRDAMLRLRNNGFSILALAMKVPHCAEPFLVDRGSGEASGGDCSADIGTRQTAAYHNLWCRWRFDLGADEDELCQANGGDRRSPWPVINPESVALVTRLRLFVVFFVVSQRQKKGAEEGEALRVPIRSMCWLGMEGYPKSLFRGLF